MQRENTAAAKYALTQADPMPACTVTISGDPDAPTQASVLHMSRCAAIALGGLKNEVEKAVAP